MVVLKFEMERNPLGNTNQISMRTHTIYKPTNGATPYRFEITGSTSCMVACNLLHTHRKHDPTQRLSGLPFPPFVWSATRCGAVSLAARRGTKALAETEQPTHKNSDREKVNGGALAIDCCRFALPILSSTCTL